MQTWRAVLANTNPRRLLVFCRFLPSQRRASSHLTTTTATTTTTVSRPRAWPDMASLAMPLRTAGRSAELIADQLDKPATDDREYRVVRLGNQLEVLLASDKKVDMASAALAVNVGSFRDGDTPGTAHAVEHFLFMGSEKYPVDNDFKSHIGSHGGASNASTSPCSTVYHFQITSADNSTEAAGPSPFYGALDRFSQFFTAPLFLASTLDREINAVDSEFKLKYQSDDRRLFQLGRSLSNPEHPYNGFSTGNLHTLRDVPAEKGVDMRAKFVDFHRTHYSANIMKLCVLGKEPLDTLQEWVVDMFSDIANQDLPQNRWDDVPLWSESQLPRRVYTRPIMDIRQLRVSFPWLDEEHLFENRPGDYIGAILSHKGEGSLLAYLKDKSWAASVSGDTTSICPGTTGVLTVEVGLTELGLEHHEDVTKAVFQYIAMLQENPSQLESFVAESRQLADLAFYYRQKSDSRTFASSTARRMMTPLPPKWYVGIGNRSKEFNVDLMTKALRLLQPDKARITLISQKYPGTWEQKEKWYGTEYTEEALPESLLSDLWDIFNNNRTRPAELHLPAKNPFIPENLDIAKTAGTFTTPRMLRDTSPTIRSWHKQDDTFLVPKAIITASLHHPALYASADNEAHAALLTELVTDALQRYSYAAALAGLHYSVSLSSRGLFVYLSGYNDKLPLLLGRVLATLLRDLEVREDRLDMLRERLLRACRNSELRKPCIQIPRYEPWLLSADTPSASPQRLDRQLIPGLESITVESMHGFLGQIVRGLSVEMYSHGNVTREEAVEITRIVEDRLQAGGTQGNIATIASPAASRNRNSPAPRNLEVLIPRALVIPPSVNFRYTETIRDPDDVNNCISYYIQLSPQPTLLPRHNDFSSDDPDIAALRALRAKLELLCHIIRPRVFHQLRTKEQLGYVVRTRLVAAQGGARGSRLCGLAIEVQSEKACEYLEQRVDAFLATLLARRPSDSAPGEAGAPESAKKTVLGDMTDAAFEAEKRGVIDKMLEKPKNMTKDNDRFWARIRDEGYDFDQAEKDAKHVLSITKQDLVQFVQTYIAPQSQQRSSLVIYLRSHKAATSAIVANDVQPDREHHASEEDNHGAAAAAAAGHPRIDIADIRDWKGSLVADVGPRRVQKLDGYRYEA